MNKELTIEEKAKAYDKAFETINRDEFAQDVLRGAAINPITWIDYNAAECEDIKNALVNGDWDKICAYMEKKLEKQGEKSQSKSALEEIKEKKVDNANKVEPKFHEGDWVIYNNDICQIVKREEGCNKLVTVFGIEKELVNERNLSTARLWTIQDAKLGDVLANDHHILILKELDYDWSSNGTPSAVKAYCGIKPNGNFEIGKDNWCFCGTLHIHPATKEQRDLLFAKMKEAGYKLDKDFNVIKI